MYMYRNLRNQTKSGALHYTTTPLFTKLVVSLSLHLELSVYRTMSKRPCWTDSK